MVWIVGYFLLFLNSLQPETSSAIIGPSPILKTIYQPCGCESQPPRRNSCGLGFSRKIPSHPLPSPRAQPKKDKLFVIHGSCGVKSLRSLFKNLPFNFKECSRLTVPVITISRKCLGLQAKATLFLGSPKPVSEQVGS